MQTLISRIFHFARCGKNCGRKNLFELVSVRQQCQASVWEERELFYLHQVSAIRFQILKDDLKLTFLENWLRRLDSSLLKDIGPLFQAFFRCEWTEQLRKGQLSRSEAVQLRSSLRGISKALEVIEEVDQRRSESHEISSKSKSKVYFLLLDRVRNGVNRNGTGGK